MAVNLKRVRVVCGLLPVVWALVAAMVPEVFGGGQVPRDNTAVLAQFDGPATPSPAPGPALQFGMPLKIGALVLLVLLCVFVIWPPLYRVLLERERDPVWPLSLYGRLAAMFWFVFWMLALGILWYDLPVNRQTATFFSEHGMRCLLVLLALVGSLSLMLLFRSYRPKPRDDKELSSGN